MKKIFTVALIFIMAAFILSGCSSEKEILTQKSYTSEKAVAAVNIDVRDREIEVALSEDDFVHIDYFESEKEFFDISLSDSQVLTMKFVSDKNWNDYIGGKSEAASKKILVKIPDKLLSSLTLSTTNKNITLCGLSVKNDVSVSVNGGNINFENMSVGNNLLLTAKNGNIKGSVTGGYDDFSISCEIKKGDSNLPAEKNGGDKNLAVSNNNGDIDIEFVKE